MAQETRTQMSNDDAWKQFSIFHCFSFSLSSWNCSPPRGQLIQGGWETRQILTPREAAAQPNESHSSNLQKVLPANIANLQILTPANTGKYWLEELWQILAMTTLVPPVPWCSTFLAPSACFRRDSLRDSVSFCFWVKHHMGHLHSNY